MGCTWRDYRSNTSLTGTLDFKESVTSGIPYGSLIIFCDIQPPREDASQCWGQGEAEGVARTCSGALELQLGGAKMYPYEQREEATVHAPWSQCPFSANLVLCGPPVFGSTVPESVVQWIKFHMHPALAVSKVFLYNVGSITAEHAQQLLRPFLDSNTLELLDYTEETVFPSWAHGQHLGIQDCLYRNRNSASWVAYGDMDEYMEPVFPPPTTLASFLKQQERAGVPWLSRGNFIFEHHCNGTGDLWGPEEPHFAVERVLFRERKAYCADRARNPDLCTRSVGRRKLIVNPRRVLLLGAHEVERLSDEVSGKPHAPGVDLRVSDQLQHGHFRSLTTSRGWCREVGDARLRELTYTTSIAEMATTARLCTLQDHSSKLKC